MEKQISDQEESVMSCYNCGRNAMFVGPERIPLCLDCNIKLQNTLTVQNEQLARMINFCLDQADAAVPIPGSSLPRIPLSPRPIVHTGGITLNNIHLTNSEVGVLNTGTIGTVDSTVTVLKQLGNNDLAAAVTQLTEAVIKSNQIAEDQKNEIIELIGALSGEVVAPKEQRKVSVIKIIISRLSELLSGATALSKIWEHAKTLFHQVFG